MQVWTKTSLKNPNSRCKKTSKLDSRVNITTTSKWAVFGSTDCLLHLYFSITSSSSVLIEKKTAKNSTHRMKIFTVRLTQMARQNPFDQKKASILAEIRSDKPDLSPKGDVDVLCYPIMDLINSHSDMVTTSSCSGRLSVFLEGDKKHNGVQKSGGKGEGGRWLYVTHKCDEVTGWIDKIDRESYTFVQDGFENAIKDPVSSNRLVLYKYEPFILHVKCRDFAMASKLYNTAMGCGFRESGIGSNNLVAIRINIKLDVPVGYWDEKSNKVAFCVPADYITLIDSLTSSKFQENARKMQVLYDRIKASIIDSV